MTVKLRRRSPRYPDLTPGQPNIVIGIEGGDFRILDGSGRPYLYPPRPFQVLDPHAPDDWVTDGERYAYPAPLNHPGFFEDFFDARPRAVKTFWRVSAWRR